MTSHQCLYHLNEHHLSLNDARLDGISTDDLSIDPQTGEVTLASNPDYETGAQYTFIVGAYDGVNTPAAIQSVTLDVNNLDDAAPTVNSGATVAAATVAPELTVGAASSRLLTSNVTD